MAVGEMYQYHGDIAQMASAYETGGSYYDSNYSNSVINHMNGNEYCRIKIGAKNDGVRPIHSSTSRVTSPFMDIVRANLVALDYGLSSYRLLKDLLESFLGCIICRKTTH